MNSASNKLVKQNTKAPKTLTSEQVFDLVKFVTDAAEVLPFNHRAIRDRLAVLIMLDAGLRVGELVQLEITDLFRFGLPVENLVVRAEIAKGKRERIIPISERVGRSIRAMSSIVWSVTGGLGNNYALPNHRGNGSLSIRQVQRICHDAGMIACRIDLHPHMLRHTFGTRVMQTSNIRIVQALLGHISLSSTQIYTHPNSDDLKKAISSISS